MSIPLSDSNKWFHYGIKADLSLALNIVNKPCKPTVMLTTTPTQVGNNSFMPHKPCAITHSILQAYLRSGLSQVGTSLVLPVLIASSFVSNAYSPCDQGACNSTIARYIMLK